jgi:hypothetical protein
MHHKTLYKRIAEGFLFNNHTFSLSRVASVHAPFFSKQKKKTKKEVKRVSPKMDNLIRRQLMFGLVIALFTIGG